MATIGRIIDTIWRILVYGFLVMTVALFAITIFSPGTICRNAVSTSHFCKGGRDGQLRSSVFLVNTKMKLPVEISRGVTLRELTHENEEAIFRYAVSPNLIGGITYPTLNSFENDSRLAIYRQTCLEKNDFSFLNMHGITALHRFQDASGAVLLEIRVGLFECTTFKESLKAQK